jgi:carbamoyltransferase
VAKAQRIEPAPEDRRLQGLARLKCPRSQIPAVTHVDNSARVQTVCSQMHGRFYRLLRRFHELTGCAVLVNTSFNVRGEPIVCTPTDAYRCFMNTGLDVLVMENHLLLKSEQTPQAGAEQESYVQLAMD